jgi:PAS domain S-box-containing protein
MSSILRSFAPEAAAKLEGQHYVLVVEDHESLAAEICQILERQGCRTKVVTTGVEARQELATDRPALMILDYSLADMTANHLIHQLANDGLNVPFIVCTGQGSEQIAVEMMRCGARDYLVKDNWFLELLPTAVARVLTEVEASCRLAQAEQALRESEQRFRTVVEASGAGTWAVDLRHQAVHYDDRLKQLIDVPTDSPGLSYAAAISRMHPDDRTEAIRHLMGHFERGEPLRLELRFERGGEYIWLLIASQVLRDTDGQVMGMIGSVLDTTLQKQTAAALEQSEQRYRNLIESSPDGIYVNQMGRFVYVNSALVKLLGAQSTDELLGTSVFDRIDPGHNVMVIERIRKQLESATSAPLLEERFVRLDGQVIDVEVTAMPCIYDDAPATQVIVRDISDRKRSQAEAREHQAQLAHVMRVHTMGKMVSELAHEINQPLYAIANYAAACREVMAAAPDPVTVETARWVEQIADQANRAGEIIRQVSEFVRKERPRRAAINLNDLLRDIVRFLELDARSHETQIQLALYPGPLMVLIDRVQIEQVVVNLVLNAIEAMEQNPASDRLVTIIAGIDESQALVSVRDRGCGVEAESANRLFEPFFTTKTKGLGLGLVISRSIVESHKGRLWAESNPDRGMTLHFTLPIPAKIA